MNSTQEQQRNNNFEHLSNEIIYEIFEFLDYFHAYDAFYNLNIRYRNLFIRSSLPLKLNLSYTGKVTFENYCQLVVMHNKHRIKAFCMSTRLCIDHFLMSFSIDSSFIRLEVLTLHRISSNKLIPLLKDLASLPRLFSLTITTEGQVQEPNIIHQLIFALPVLQFCNTSFDWQVERFVKPTLLYTANTLQHLAIDGPYNLDDVRYLLNHTPQLTRLSCYRLLVENNTQLNIPITLPNLTHLHLHLSMSFDQFQQLISNFYHRLEVLRISALAFDEDGDDHLNTDYLHVNRWQQLISSHMPRLHFFDLQCFGKIHRRNSQTYHKLINGFDSLFWIRRGWLFAHHYYEFNSSTWLIFHSIHTLKQREKNVDAIREIATSDPTMAVKYTCRLPHSSRLTLTGTLYKRSYSFVSDLSCIVPLTLLTEIVLICDSFGMNQLINLLHLASNVRLLTLLTSTRCPISDEDTINSIDQESNEDMPNRGLFTLKHVQALMRVCPRLQSLEMTINENYLELIVRFLLLLDTSESHRLCLLRLRDAHYGMVRRLHKMIDVEKLIEQYTLEHISNMAYLWW